MVDFKASVGMTELWDARKAGREVAKKTMSGLGGKKPDFFLLYSTIHYEKYGGFQEFLDGVWEILPAGTPLIGGTVAGFMCKEGCFVHGASAMAVSYQNMDVAVGFGRNTKRNPQKAARECEGMIKKQQRKEKYKNNLFLNMISGPTKPTFAGFGSQWVLKEKIAEKIGPALLKKSTQYLQKGHGLEDEVICELTKHINKDDIVFGGSSTDDDKIIKNYQFFGKQIKENAIVAMKINTDINIGFGSEHGLHSTGKKFKITKSSQNNRIIEELDGKSATDVFFNSIGLTKEQLTEKIHDITYFYPLGFKDKDDYLCPHVVGSIINNIFILSYRIKGKDIEILTTTGKKMVGCVNKAIASTNINKPKMGFVVSCTARLDSLGNHVYAVRDILNNYFKENSFLLIYTAGENICFPKKEYHAFNETFNIISI
ncbi:MAG: hypothetical protein KAR87_01570 [Candidatus Aenigmarchaeota archaeon]|nr:hypothetical protein [Candidatus Aenigmarchaeota archaeon]